MANSPRRLRPHLIYFTLFTTLAALLLLRQPPIEPLPPPPDALPPLLEPLVHHHLRPAALPASRPDWKRPRILTAHAFAYPNHSALNLAIFSTGTNTQSYGRRFQPVACLIASKIVPVTRVQPEVTVCRLSQTPAPGALLTILLRVDDALHNAINTPVTLANERFEILPRDLHPIEDEANVLNLTDQVVAVRSSVRWSPGMLDLIDNSRPRHEVCLMTAMKQYPYLLPTYFSYYRRAGVDQIFIYDNFSPIDLAAIVRDYPYVQVVFWPWTRSQMQSFTHFLRASRARCKFTAFFDADEFIMIGQRGPNALRNYIRLRASQGYAQIISHFVRFLNNGYVRRPSGDLPVLYTRREKDQVFKLGKAIIDSEHSFRFHKIHIVQYETYGKTYWNATMDLNPTSLDHNAMLMHYTDRSWEENVLKKRFGGSSPMTTYRKPVELDVSDPDPSYMNLSKTVPFDGFVSRFLDVMRAPEPKTETLVWREAKLWCRREFCRSCHARRFTSKQCRPRLWDD